MMLSKEVAQTKAYEYARGEEVAITGELGFGIDGHVFRTSRGTAVKVFGRKDKYETERDIYLRLHLHEVSDILGHTVPELLNSDNRLMAIEMSIVQPPYLLDFAQATLDSPRDFTDDAMEMWRAAKAEDFGSRWTDVVAVMSLLELRFGIYLTDINPGNITFEEDNG